MWAERLAQSRLLLQMVHSAQEMEPSLQSVCTCTMSWVFFQKTIEIVGRLVEHGDRNVRATVFTTMCSLAF